MRRYLVASALAAAVAAAYGGWTQAQTSAPAAPAEPAAAAPAVPAHALEERVLGNPDAPITIVEYASLTCPHCARFHTETLDQLKAEYIDTGKAKLVYRDFPFEAVGLRAAMLARCADEDQYFRLLDVLFQNQDRWSRAADPVQALTQLGKLAGMTEERIAACFASEELQRGIVQMRLDAQNQYQVDSTPTFVINEGEARIEGAQPIEEFREALDGLAG